MTTKLKCDCCGRSVVPLDDNHVVCIPDGWRTIVTEIEEHDGTGASSVYRGSPLHSCADCNSYMDVVEHLDAEFETRRTRMDQPGSYPRNQIATPED